MSAETTRPKGESKGRRWLPLAVLAIYLLLAAVWLGKVWPDATRAVAGGPHYEDSLRSIWYLAWNTNAPLLECSPGQ